MRSINKILSLVLLCLFSNNITFGESSPLIKSGDILNIDVKGEKELSGNRLVESDGNLIFPLIGSIKVSDLKTKEVEKQIKKRLEDGFLKNPVISVSIKEKTDNDYFNNVIPMSESDITYAETDIKPKKSLVLEKVLKDIKEQLLIEIKDSNTNKGINNALIYLDNKTYQTNRLGQVILKNNNSNIVIIADGYKNISGSIKDLINKPKKGEPAFILLDKIEFNDYIYCTILDSSTNKPISRAEVIIDGKRKVTDKFGKIKINSKNKEFDEVVVKKRGYITLRKIIDYKNSSNLVINLDK